ncbi:MAG: hypothetical protein JXA89_11960 [Anaerolineae bacterium]|nr:hypothetical protein [Anaerolineae bacterium]
MDCPECGTWNPDDKLRCWRCNASLPMPEPHKKKRRVNAQIWIWIAFILLLALSTLVRCAIISGVGSDSVSWTLLL